MDPNDPQSAEELKSKEDTTESSESNQKEAEVELSAEEVLKKQLKEAEDKYTYLYADFENYKKRTWTEKEQIRKFAWESTARELVEVVDNFERALSFQPENLDKNFLQGVQMITKQLTDALDRAGVKGFESLGKDFDPNFHEAVEKRASDKKPGTIIEVRLNGYTLHGRLLRAAQVVVSEGK